MSARLLLSLASACCIGSALAGPAPGAAPAAGAPSTEPATTAAAPPASTATAATVAPAAPVTAAPAAAAPAAPMPLATASAGSLLQTILALSFVLALLIGMAWFMKRYGPKTGGNSATLRVVGALSLGGRERVMLVEVADQWIVVGAAPGRVNLLSTMARPAGGAPQAETGLVSSNFAEWLKQTIEKRNGK